MIIIMEKHNCRVQSCFKGHLNAVVAFILHNMYLFYKHLNSLYYNNY